MREILDGENQAFFFCGVILGGCPQPFYVSDTQAGIMVPLCGVEARRSKPYLSGLPSLLYVFFMEPGLSSH